MDAAAILELAEKSGLDDRESLVSFALGFASGAADRDSDEVVYLFGSPDSISTVGILAFLYDAASIPFQLAIVDVNKDEHRRPDFAAMNPYQAVPVIDHGGYVLHESNAILRYLCRAFPTAASRFYGHGDIHIQGLIDAALDERQQGILRQALPLLLPLVGFA
jgi:glutathione S-transferase